MPVDIFVTRLEQLGYDIKVDLDRFLLEINLPLEIKIRDLANANIERFNNYYSNEYDINDDRLLSFQIFSHDNIQPYLDGNCFYFTDKFCLNDVFNSGNTFSHLKFADSNERVLFDVNEDIQKLMRNEFPKLKRRVVKAFHEYLEEIETPKVYRARGQRANTLNIKIYKDGHLGFAIGPAGGDENSIKCWFNSYNDALHASGSSSAVHSISHTSDFPRENVTIKINGINVIISENSYKKLSAYLIQKSKIDENFICEKLEGDKLIENRGSNDTIHITVKSYKDKQTLFDIKQEKDEDDLHFYVRIENGRETFEYSRKIETQEDFCKALEQTINALENYSEFYEQKDELKEILEKFIIILPRKVVSL